jgi:hypothetical protein
VRKSAEKFHPFYAAAVFPWWLNALYIDTHTHTHTGFWLFSESVETFTEIIFQNWPRSLHRPFPLHRTWTMPSFDGVELYYWKLHLVKGGKITQGIVIHGSRCAFASTANSSQRQPARLSWCSCSSERKVVYIYASSCVCLLCREISYGARAWWFSNHRLPERYPAEVFFCVCEQWISRLSSLGLTEAECVRKERDCR